MKVQFPFLGKKKYVVMLYSSKSDTIGGNGGLGDRIVGLVSTILLAKKTGRKLKIWWQFPDMSTVFQISDEYLATEKIQMLLEKNKAKNNVRNLEMIDKQEKYKDILISKDLNSIWPEDVWVCRSNQNYIQYLYKNPSYAQTCKNYQEDLIQTYRAIFNEYLLPTSTVLKSISNSYKKIVSIQIRMGDHYMGVGSHQPVSNINQAKIYLEQVKKKLSEMNIGADQVDVFVTSDHDGIHSLARDVFNQFTVIGDTLGITHVDRKPETEKLEGLFRDFLILCKSDYLFFSLWSNFGRVAALINNNQVYAFNLDGDVNQVDWRTLSSKHEILTDV